MSGMNRDSHGSTCIYIGADAYIGCSTYTTGTHPILTINVPHNSLSISPVGYRDPITDDDLAKAHDLARAVAIYVAEVERLHAEGSSDGNPDTQTPQSAVAADAAV